jgi:hypothetical protein
LVPLTVTLTRFVQVTFSVTAPPLEELELDEEEDELVLPLLELEEEELELLLELLEELVEPVVELELLDDELDELLELDEELEELLELDEEELEPPPLEKLMRGLLNVEPALIIETSARKG